MHFSQIRKAPTQRPLCPRKDRCAHAKTAVLSSQPQQTILSAMSRTDADFNFCRASARDGLAFGCSRPGFPSKQVTKQALSSWIRFMHTRGIMHVLSLLHDDEKEFFKFDIDEAMRESFGSNRYTRVSVFAANSRSVISAALNAARNAQESIIIHCSGGEGRAVLGMGIWLIESYGLRPEEAAREMQQEAARDEGIARRVNANKLAYFVRKGTLAGYRS